MTSILEIPGGREDSVNTPYSVFRDLFKARAANAARVFVIQRGGGGARLLDATKVTPELDSTL